MAALRCLARRAVAAGATQQRLQRPALVRCSRQAAARRPLLSRASSSPASQPPLPPDPAAPPPAPPPRSESPFRVSAVCWHCGDLLPSASSLYCVACGIPQQTALHADFFTLLQSPRAFAVSPSLLTATYRKLQKKLHPDRFARADAPCRGMSASLSARVNVAYSTLMDAHERALYLLQLSGRQLEEEAREADPSLLMEVLQLREELESLQEEQGSSSAERALRLQALHATVSARLQRLHSQLSAAFAASDWGRVKQLIGELAYFNNIHTRTTQLAPVQA